MNLKDFIKESLSQIAEGIASADADVIKQGGAINPRDVIISSDIKGAYGIFADDQKGKFRRIVQSIQFDVVVSAVESEQTKGGIGIHVGYVGFGGTEKSDSQNSSESRIKFSVPMLYPDSKMNYGFKQSD